jgi:hypothetical protein
LTAAVEEAMTALEFDEPPDHENFTARDFFHTFKDIFASVPQNCH